MLGSATYGGTRPFFQTKLDGVTSSVVGEVTFNIFIDFQNRLFCSNTCTITIDTVGPSGSFGGNIDATATIDTVDYNSLSGTTENIIFTDSNITDTRFTGTFGNLINVNDSITVIIANNLLIEVFFDSGTGDSGSTVGPVVTDARSP